MPRTDHDRILSWFRLTPIAPAANPTALHGAQWIICERCRLPGEKAKLFQNKRLLFHPIGTQLLLPNMAALPQARSGVKIALENLSALYADRFLLVACHETLSQS